MAAITWRNIEAPDFRGAGALVNAGNQGIATAGQALTQALSNYQAGQESAKQDRIRDNTNEFMNALYANYKSPAALQSAIADGSIDRALQGFGKEIDFNVVRGAADSRLGQQQQQQSSALKFQQEMLAATQAPILAQHQAAVMRGDKQAAAALEARLDPSQLGKAAKVVYDVAGTNLDRDVKRNKAENDTLRTQYAGDKNAREAALAPLEQQNLRARTTASMAAANASNASARNSNAQTSLIGSKKQADNLSATLIGQVNNAIDKNNAAFDKIWATGQLDMFIPKDSRGRPDFTSMSTEALGALQEALPKGIDVFTRAGLRDAEYATAAAKAATNAGITGEAFTSFQKNLPNAVGAGRFIQEGDTAAGKARKAAEDRELADRQAVSGSLVSARKLPELLPDILKALPKEDQEVAQRGLLAALRDPANKIKGANKEELMLDPATMSKILLDRSGRGGGIFGRAYGLSTADASHYQQAITDWIKDNSDALRKENTVKEALMRERLKITQ